MRFSKCHFLPSEQTLPAVLNTAGVVDLADILIPQRHRYFQGRHRNNDELIVFLLAGYS